MTRSSTIRISDDTRERIRAYRIKGDSQDQTIRRILDKFEEIVKTAYYSDHPTNIFWDGQTKGPQSYD